MALTEECSGTTTEQVLHVIMRARRNRLAAVGGIAVGTRVAVSVSVAPVGRMCLVGCSYRGAKRAYLPVHSVAGAVGITRYSSKDNAMCFSATGSLGVGAILAGIGALSVAQDKLPSHRMLAVVPLLFAGQQIAEGVVWMTIDHPSQNGVHVLAVAVFLSFALVIWPSWVPLSLLLAETNPRRRKVLSVLAWVGIGVAIYAGVVLIRGRPTAHIAGHSMAYTYVEAGSQRVRALYLPMYIVPALIPFFVSTLKMAKLMGTILAVALVVTFVVERTTLTSVWCFFAAILSGVIVMGIAAEHRVSLHHKTA
jgi:uncharacterized protein DUF6629